MRDSPGQRATPGSRTHGSSAAARSDPSGGSSLPTARRPSRVPSRCPTAWSRSSPRLAATEQYADLASAAATWTLVEDRALASLSDSVTPAGVVAVCRFLDVPLDEICSRSRCGSVSDEPRDPRTGRRAPRLVVICADVRDPGNAGTVIRTADAAGAGRRRAGRQLGRRLQPQDRPGHGGQPVPPAGRPVVADPAAAVGRRPRRRARRCWPPTAPARSTSTTPTTCSPGPTAWLFGNEAHGLPDELAGAADHRVRIPIHGRAESLNLSTAAAVCLYASARAATPLG